MDYSRHDLADRLASEYVLGTLRGPARRRFENLLGAHPALQRAVARWQHRLAPLSDSVAEVPPPERVWQRIESQLFGRRDMSTPLEALSPWRRLSLWRTLTGLATVVALGLFMVARQVPPPQAPTVVVLDANLGAAQPLNASFVASISADRRALVLRPLNSVELTPRQTLQLWAVPAHGAPRSLGLVQAAGATTLLRVQLSQDTAALAVSLEPPGGSPTGAPTGPIVSIGKLQT
jgi:anti-sigma-K factor RskA